MVPGGKALPGRVTVETTRGGGSTGVGDLFDRVTLPSGIETEADAADADGAGAASEDAAGRPLQLAVASPVLPEPVMQVVDTVDATAGVPGVDVPAPLPTSVCKLLVLLLPTNPLRDADEKRRPSLDGQAGRDEGHTTCGGGAFARRCPLLLLALPMLEDLPPPPR